MEAATALCEAVQSAAEANATNRPTEEGQKLLLHIQQKSKDEADKLNTTIMKRNLILVFDGPSHSALDSSQVRSRKKALEERCAMLSAMPPLSVVRWAQHFQPSVWAPGTMSQDTFEYLVHELRSNESMPSADVGRFLSTLGAEEPLKKNQRYLEMIRGVLLVDSIPTPDLTID